MYFMDLYFNIIYIGLGNQINIITWQIFDFKLGERLWFLVAG